MKGGHPPEPAEFRVGDRRSDGALPVVVIAEDEPKVEPVELLERSVGPLKLLVELTHDLPIAHVGVRPLRHFDPIVVQVVAEYQPQVTPAFRADLVHRLPDPVLTGLAGTAVAEDENDQPVPAAQIGDLEGPRLGSSRRRGQPHQHEPDNDGHELAHSSLSAPFDRRCIPASAALGVVQDGSNTPGILPPRASRGPTAA